MHATRVYLVLSVSAFIAMQYNLLCNTSFNKQGQAQCAMNGADYTAMIIIDLLIWYHAIFVKIVRWFKICTFLHCKRKHTYFGMKFTR